MAGQSDAWSESRILALAGVEPSLMYLENRFLRLLLKLKDKELILSKFHHEISEERLHSATNVVPNKQSHMPLASSLSCLQDHQYCAQQEPKNDAASEEEVISSPLTARTSLQALTTGCRGLEVDPGVPPASVTANEFAEDDRLAAEGSTCSPSGGSRSRSRKRPSRICVTPRKRGVPSEPDQERSMRAKNVRKAVSDVKGGKKRSDVEGGKKRSDVEEIKEKSDVDEMKKASDVEEMKKASDVEEMKKASDVEEMKKASDVEEMKKASDVEEMKKASDVEEIKKASDVEEMKKASDVEEIKKGSDLEEIKKNASEGSRDDLNGSNVISLKVLRALKLISKVPRQPAILLVPLPPPPPPPSQQCVGRDLSDGGGGQAADDTACRDAGTQPTAGSTSSETTLLPSPRQPPGEERTDEPKSSKLARTSASTADSRRKKGRAKKVVDPGSEQTAVSVEVSGCTLGEIGSGRMSAGERVVGDSSSARPRVLDRPGSSSGGTALSGEVNKSADGGGGSEVTAVEVSKLATDTLSGSPGADSAANRTGRGVNSVPSPTAAPKPGSKRPFEGLEGSRYSRAKLKKAIKSVDMTIPLNKLNVTSFSKKGRRISKMQSSTSFLPEIDQDETSTTFSTSTPHPLLVLKPFKVPRLKQKEP